MIYTRGNRRDYDHWAKMGNEGWSFKDVLPYFKYAFYMHVTVLSETHQICRKIENFAITGNISADYHGKNGYLSVSYAPYRTKIADAIVNASLQYGLPYVDYNGPTQVRLKTLFSINKLTKHFRTC